MLKDSEILLIKLNGQYNNLMEIIKLEKDIKNLKQFEKDINKISGLIKVLSNFINYYKMKEIKSQS